MRQGYVWSEDHAEYFFDFAKQYCRHSKGKWRGKPIILLPWQREVFGEIFGWIRKGTHIRRYRTAYIQTAKKNGKSTLGAVVGNYLFVHDDEPGAEVYSVATKRDQAAIVHDEAVRMFRQSDGLLRPIPGEKQVELNKTTKQLTWPYNDSIYKALASESKGIEGLNVSGLIVDELHRWEDRSFWDALIYGSVSRENPLTLIVTTAGVYDPKGICFEVYQKAKDILSGKKVDVRFYGFIAEPPPGVDVYDPDIFCDPKVHEAANPSYGVTIDPDEIMEAAQSAKDKPSELSAFLRYRLNVWVEKMNALFDMAAWDRCRGDYTEDDLIGRPCWGGLDLSSHADLTAFMLLFPPMEEEGDDGKWKVLTRAWVPQEAVRQRAEERGKYGEWSRDGYLFVTPRNRIDLRMVMKQIIHDCERFDLTGGIATDPWRLDYLPSQYEALRNGQDEEFDKYPDVGDLPTHFWKFQQTARFYSEPLKRLEAMIAEGKIEHDGNPVLEWCLGNSIPDTDGKDNIVLSKKKSRDKIDCAVALAMAVAMSMTRSGEEEPTEYRGDGLIMI